jgi:hypothetical protein
MAADQSDLYRAGSAFVGCILARGTAKYDATR